MVEIISTIIKTFLSVCFVLGTIALVHEFGHFITAKLAGIWVLEFAIGFGNRIFKKKIGNTIYSLRPLPLGGFVRLAGMEPPEESENLENQSKTTENNVENCSNKSSLANSTIQITNNNTTPNFCSENSALLDNEDENLEKYNYLPPNDPRGFISKSRTAKIAVLSAGSIMNLLWAVVLFFVIYSIAGGPISNIYVLDVIPNQPAQLAGIKPGDIITAINGQKIEEWSEAIRFIQNSSGATITLDIARDHPIPLHGFGGSILPNDYVYNYGEFTINKREILKIQVVPVGPQGAAKIGIGLSPNTYDYKVLPFNRAIKKAWESALGIIIQTIGGLIRIITRETQADVAGPVKIIQMIKEHSHKGIFDLFYLTALLSINIGLINLLPLPVLDGGRIVFVLLETLFTFINLITGLNLVITPKWEERIHFIGLIFLLILLLLVTYQDIKNLL